MAKRLDVLLVLQARVEARALLWKLGNYADLNEMMQPLYGYAIKTGLFEKFGGVEFVDGLMLGALEE